jgi:FKBP12-rapamycin complex-associated protein
VAHCDTLHALIREYREPRGISLSAEHKAMLALAPEYDHLTVLQRVEVFGRAMAEHAPRGDDLRQVLWLRCADAENWFSRRLTYMRSLAVMSMLGYVLGLGDRHPSNLLMDRVSGQIVHIDFGDCFEVAMRRARYPERVPFRLTRMLRRAMEAGEVEGTFRRCCQVAMQVLRDARDSLMAVLEAFIYDPLINWRLLLTTTNVAVNYPALDPHPSHQSQDVHDQGANHGLPQNKLSESGRWSHIELTRRLEEESLARPETSTSSGAINALNRVAAKLTGRLITAHYHHSAGGQLATGVAPESPVSVQSASNATSVEEQVDELIREATRLENLCQAYIGWCAFW